MATVLLSLDPSSTRTGFSVSTGRLSLIEAGMLNPADASNPPYVRAWTMADDAVELCREHGVNQIVIEGPAPQSPRMGNRGQAAYGMAVGVIWARLRLLEIPLQVVAVDVWTAKVSKAHQAACVASDFPEYAAMRKRDPGMDVADAIGLAVWWWQEQKVRGAA